MNVFEEIKDRLDIQEVYTFYTGNSVERNRKALCCFHNDTRPSLSFKGHIFKCFVCDAGGDVFKLVELLFNLKGIQAAKKLSDDFGLGLVKDYARRDRRQELIARKRQAELRRKQEKERAKAQKAWDDYNKIKQLLNWIDIMETVLDVSDDDAVFDWAEAEIREAEYELDELMESKKVKL